jgi:hypothetical protein
VARIVLYLWHHPYDERLIQMVKQYVQAKEPVPTGPRADNIKRETDIDAIVAAAKESPEAWFHWSEHASYDSAKSRATQIRRTARYKDLPLKFRGTRDGDSGRGLVIVQYAGEKSLPMSEPVYTEPLLLDFSRLSPMETVECLAAVGEGAVWRIPVGVIA